MPGEELRYRADGLQMIGSLHRPPGGGRAPGVLVFPQGSGIGEHTRDKAERIARELGYVALACDLFGDGRVAGGEELRATLGALRASAEHLRARTGGALEALLAQPEVDAARVAAIGFCFGGTMAFELACSGADLKAAIGFHSGLQVTTPQDVRRIKGKVMALLGADDPSVTAEHRAAFERMMTEAGVDWQMTLYGGVVHSFTDKDAARSNQPQFLRYDARADRRSWARMAALLEEVFAEPA
jgi:dienelactone hydrolase